MTKTFPHLVQNSTEFQLIDRKRLVATQQPCVRFLENMSCKTFYLTRAYFGRTWIYDFCFLQKNISCEVSNKIETVNSKNRIYLLQGEAVLLGHPPQIGRSQC